MKKDDPDPVLQAQKVLELACDTIGYDAATLREAVAARATLERVSPPERRRSLRVWAGALCEQTQARIATAQAAWEPRAGEPGPMPGFYYVEQVTLLSDALQQPPGDCSCASRPPGGLPHAHGHIAALDAPAQVRQRTSRQGTRVDVCRYRCDFCGQVWSVELERGYDRDRVTWRREPARGPARGES